MLPMVLALGQLGYNRYRIYQDLSWKIKHHIDRPALLEETSKDIETIRTPD
jgi:hypothetical protein